MTTSTRRSDLCSDFSFEGRPVFLGGSCNPTLWRKDVAIPYLSARGISFFNPQVSCWSPDLIPLENKAKQEARVNLFVIDWQTRSVAALVEVAHLVAGPRGSSLVVALYDLEPGHSFSASETRELKQARELVRSLVLSRQLPVYPSLQAALKETEHKVQLPSNLRSPKQASRKTRLKSATLVRTSYKPSLNLTRVWWQKSFKSLVIKSCHLASSLSLFWHWITDRCSSTAQLTIVSSDLLLFKEEMESRLQNVDYKLVSPLSLAHAEDLLKLFSRKEEDTPLLVVLSGRQRALMEMVLAAHLIGCRSNLVICIQDILPKTCLNGEESSEEAIKDYNRGRSYLEDLALQHTVPVFTDVGAALDMILHHPVPL